MIWILTLWPVSWLLIYFVQVYTVWQSVKQRDYFPQYVARLGKWRALRTALVICLPTFWTDLRLFILGPVGLWAIWVTRKRFHR